MYKPLPNYLTIRNSGIEGLGLFATEKIEQGTNFGVCHIPNEDYENGYIRTPLGGFINHSDNPNCEKVKLRFTNEDDPKLRYDFKKWNLITIQDIKPGEELTIKYEWYQV